jgi:transcriptional regulator with PAS, ATPase and Fis domain
MRPPAVPAELVSMLELLPGCRLLIDAEYRVVASNTCYRDHCHAGSERDVVGRHCYEVSHGYDAPCDQKGESCPLHTSLALGRAERCIHVHHSAQGVQHVEVELLPLRDDTGRVRLFMEHMQALSGSGGGGYIGNAPAFLHMLEMLKRVAPTETSVLLLGETGTGKEVMARAAHDMSARADKPFVVVDCAGLPETLFESELFGHEKGAYTGAGTRKPGLVEAAAGGTLFIDEIGEVPLSLQVKLLRLLETGLFRRVGGTEMLRADFRLVSATHRDLQAMVARGDFRADLYYRISAFPVDVPALRERRGDVSLLAASILARLDRSGVLGLTPRARDALDAYAFPGNVRELRNILERATLLTDTAWIDLQHLPEGVRASAPPPMAAEDGGSGSPLLAAERAVLQAALHSRACSRRELAAQLGISERTLYRKLRGLTRARGSGRRP